MGLSQSYEKTTAALFGVDVKVDYDKKGGLSCFTLDSSGVLKVVSCSGSGLTLIELLVVIAIISIIGAVGVPWYQGYKIQAKEKQAINNLQSIRLAQTEYYRDRYNYYPCPVAETSTSEIDEVFFGGNGGLSKGAYDYKITGGCSTYSVNAIPK